jgi:hypothetical protein
MRNTREHVLSFASLLHGNALFETMVLSLGTGRPAERGLLADTLRHAGVSPKLVTAADVTRLLPVIQRRLASLTSETLAAERVRSFCNYLERRETALASVA